MSLLEAAGEKPLVGVIMGSDSDLPAMKPASDMLGRFAVPHETRIVSAHRTPGWMDEYAGTALDRGLRVIIAGAGGSAHLPGMTASECRLPVLGVAIDSRQKPMQAAVGSQIEMPKGIPLAYMGEGEAGAANAALEAVRILALADDELGEAYDAYVEALALEVVAKDAALLQLGVEGYLDAQAAAGSNPNWYKSVTPQA